MSTLRRRSSEGLRKPIDIADIDPFPLQYVSVCSDRRSWLVGTSAGPAGLQEAFEGGEHADLKGSAEALMAKHLADFFLDEPDDKALSGILDPDRLVVHVYAAASPFAAVEILGEVLTVGLNRCHATNQEFANDSLVRGIFEALLSQILVWPPSPEDVELVPEMRYVSSTAFADRRLAWREGRNAESSDQGPAFAAPEARTRSCATSSRSHA